MVAEVECFLIPSPNTPLPDVYICFHVLLTSTSIACLTLEGFGDFIPDVKLKGLGSVLPGKEKGLEKTR